MVVRREENGGVAASLRMFNPDGSEFERSGNGLRVLAAWLHQRGRVGEAPFTVIAGGDMIGMCVHSRDSHGRYDVEVEMGLAQVRPRGCGAWSSGRPRRPRADRARGVLGPCPSSPVSVGNPHAVVFADDGRAFERGALERLGPALATHPGFAHGTNVQLARATPTGDARHPHLGARRRTYDRFRDQRVRGCGCGGVQRPAGSGSHRGTHGGR